MKTVKPDMVSCLDNYVRILMKKGDLFSIDMNNVIFGKVLVEHDWLSDTVIAVYARYLCLIVVT